MTLSFPSSKTVASAFIFMEYEYQVLFFYSHMSWMLLLDGFTEVY